MELAQWIRETYRDQLGLGEVEGSRKFRRFLGGALAEPALQFVDLSGVARARRFISLKLGYPLRRAGYSMAAISARARAGREEAEAVFAFAYWQAGAESPEYICVSPTFTSQDGEYRAFFMQFGEFEGICEAILGGPAGRGLEEAVLDSIAGGGLEADVRFFPEEAGDALAGSAENSRVAVKVLAATLARDLEEAHRGGLQEHTHPGYARVLGLLWAGEAPLRRAAAGFKEKFLGGDPPAGAGGRLRDQLLVARNWLALEDEFRCGQKLTPLTIREVAQVGDIGFAPWREVWVARLASDLVANGAAPMFPIYNNWALVGGGEDLFENPSARARFARSLRARASADSLREARARLAAGGEADARAAQLDARTLAAIDYAKDFVILSDLALLSTGEHAGRTLRSALAGGDFPRLFADGAMQARYLFDLCYGAHALHSRLGVVHADLHLNNITLYRTAHRGFPGGGRPPPVKNPLVAFVAGPRGEADTFVFPHDGSFAVLIDFSRAVLGPPARARVAEEFGGPFAEGFFRAQVNRVVRVLGHYLPEYTREHQEKIKGLLLSEPSAMFEVVSAVDFLAIGRNLGAFFREAAASRGGVAPEGGRLAARVEALALEHLVGGLAQLAAEGRRPDGEGLAGPPLLAEAFAAFRFPAWAGGAGGGRPFPLGAGTLVDAYNLGRPLEFSGSDYARFPPWARLDLLSKHLGGVPVEQLARRDVRPFLRSLAHDPSFEVLRERARREGDGGDPPGADTSSWLR